jgi:DNA-binding transcriptional regulator LsrR (DeoR family)
MVNRSGNGVAGFLCEVAWLYYANDMTQAQIADQLGTTRLRINRALGTARRLGMVRVSINSPFLACLELQRALVDRFSIDHAYVVPAHRDNYDYHRAVGAALATYLNEGLAARRWKSIGVSWGLTLESAIAALMPGEHSDLDIVSMMGATTKGTSFHAFAVAAEFSRVISATYSLFAAPIYLESETLAEQITGSAQFREHIDKILGVDVAVLVAGDLSEKSFSVKYGLPPDVTISELGARGAVGDVLGRFLDVDGQEVDHPINRRVTSATLGQLKTLRSVVLAAAGPHKRKIMHAILKAGYARTLITDDVTAETLLA